MLIYSRAVLEGDQEMLPWPEDVVVRVQLSSLLPCIHTYTHLQREVERHNQIFLESVEPLTEAATQTIQVSIPSSTSASGFNTPLEAPITPGERMDLSN